MMVMVVMMTPTRLNQQVLPRTLVVVAAGMMVTAMVTVTEALLHLLDRRPVVHPTTAAAAADLRTAAESQTRARSPLRSLHLLRVMSPSL